MQTTKIKKYQHKSFVKWIGGKTQLLPELVSRMPWNYNKYIELFVGGGSLFFEVQPREAILSDLCTDLIMAYQAVRDMPELLLKSLAKHEASYEYFQEVRSADRDPSFSKWDTLNRASRFLYLNKTARSGMFRVNNNGQFNAPYGRYKNPNIVNEEKIRYCNKVLQSASLLNSDYKDVFECADRGDFVYIDPPYLTPLDGNKIFNEYTREKFSYEDQKLLRSIVDKLTNKGVKVMISNSYCPTIFSLYSDYLIDEVVANRAVNSDSLNRKDSVKEVIIRNY